MRPDTRRWLLIGALAAAWVAPALAVEPLVEVFTLSTIPVHASSVARVYQLDRLSAIEGRLSDGLPGDPQQAAAIAQARVAQGGERLQREIVEAAIGLGLALQLGLDRVPAVVIDRRYVDYGEPRVEVSLARWRRAPGPGAGR